MSLTGFITPRSHLLQKYSNCRTLFLCCDIQEKLRGRIANFNDAVEISNKMAVLHDTLTPQYATFIATEHVPQSVGPFVKDVQLPAGALLFAKHQPSMLIPEVLPYLEGNSEKGVLPVRQAVLWGHESHVCILQTADALLQRDIRVAILVDGCASQQAVDHETAMRAMTSWEGLTMSTFASVMLQLTQGEPVLTKKLHRLLKATPRPAA